MRGLSETKNLSKSINLNYGFTIVELLIVIIVIGTLAAIVIVSYTGITDSAKNATFKADITEWKHASEAYKIQHGIECPTNYVFVYGNPTLGTSDFCVMKYEAKNDGSGKAVSTASGAPWTAISQTDAITNSNAACNGCHLITEAEWMTIAADVLGIKYNWSGGEVGSGLIYQGHVHSNPSSNLAASTDDSDTLYGITGATGNTSGSNSSRVLYLKSGDAIWDFSGNVYEWTQIAVGVPTLNVNQIGVSGDSGWGWRQWNLGSLSFGTFPSSSRPSTLSSVDGIGSIGSWGSAQGLGQVFANYSDTATRALLRGGDWSSTPNSTGVLALALDRAPSYTGATMGFRVAK